MSEPFPDPAEIEAALGRAAARLDAVGDLPPFSPQAFDVVEESISDYIRTLILESARAARKAGSDGVSASDVERVSRSLFRAPVRSIAQHVGTVGGILLGAAISNTLVIVSAKHPSGANIAATIGLAVAGTFMIAFFIARDLR